MLEDGQRVPRVLEPMLFILPSASWIRKPIGRSWQTGQSTSRPCELRSMSKIQARHFVCHPGQSSFQNLQKRAFGILCLVEELSAQAHTSDGRKWVQGLDKLFQSPTLHLLVQIDVLHRYGVQPRVHLDQCDKRSQVQNRRGALHPSWYRHG